MIGLLQWLGAPTSMTGTVTAWTVRGHPPTDAALLRKVHCDYSPQCILAHLDLYSGASATDVFLYTSPASAVSTSSLDRAHDDPARRLGDSKRGILS